MAKGAYIGAPLTEVMTSNNVGSWFTLSDPDGISSWNGTTLTVTGTYSNERVKLTALRDMTVSFNYTTDDFCKISFKGQYICDEGDDGHYTATLEAGKYFYFSNSSAVSSQTCTFSNITCKSATSVAHKIKKGYVGVENFTKRLLPSGYTQVAYLESSGAQYFNTGFVPTTKTRVEADIDFMSANTTYNCVFGVGQTSSNQFVVYRNSSNMVGQVYSTKTYETSGVTNTGKNKVVLSNSVFQYGAYSATVTAESFTYTYPLFIFAMNSVGSATLHAHQKLYSCRIYDNDTLIRDYVPCKNASGVAGLYDMVNNTFSGSATSSAFIAGSSAPSVARKIKKAYIGIGGVARPCWSGGELAYYGTITPLSVARNVGGATSNKNYAIFAGSGSYDAMVDAYDKSLVRSNPSNMYENRSNCGAASVGAYALFAGGAAGSYTAKGVDAYDGSLTRKTATDLQYATHSMGSASNGNYAVFGGGYSKLAVTAYNSSLSKTNASNLNTGRCYLTGTSVGEYALMAGGSTSSSSGFSNVVDAYNTSLTRTNPTALSKARSYLAGTPVGNYALFAGGQTSSSAYSDVVDVYDTSLTRTTAGTLSAARKNMACATVGKYAIFGGGYQSNSNSGYNTVDVYNDSLTKVTMNNFSEAKTFVLGASIGDYALFAGGYGNYANKDTVEAYTVA